MYRRPNNDPGIPSMKILLALLALALPALAFAQQPTQPSAAQAKLNAATPMPPTGAALKKLNATTTIGLAPGYLHPGDQAVLLIVSPYQKNVTHPIRLNLTHPNPAIETLALFDYDNRYIGNTPDSIVVTVYHIVLKAKSYTFKPSDFQNLPPGFKFPKL